MAYQFHRETCPQLETQDLLLNRIRFSASDKAKNISPCPNGICLVSIKKKNQGCDISSHRFVNRSYRQEQGIRPKYVLSINNTRKINSVYSNTHYSYSLLFVYPLCLLCRQEH